MTEKKIIELSSNVLLYQTIGFLIKRLRNARKMSGKSLGDIIGVSQQQVSRYESGTTELTIGRIKEISTIFDMNLWQFLNIVHFLMTERKEKSL
ncbi:helix-turn-helix transcriptional regulator [Morganella morganii]|uniref:helix-turn-helix domain-containing protein n=1 Tax=Morganella morganii TaxID=582 RepID=UPI00066211F6|nr:helix-turn-helix transcriptional regulator [Morganella morganii]EMD0829198.1 helix-turn-helix transcriptional regulator [Morganella morganii]